MSRDYGKKLEDVLRGVDQDLVRKGKKSVEELLRSGDANKLRKQLEHMDREKLLETFMQMDTNEIRKKLNQMDLSKLSGLSAEDILRKLR